MLFLQNLTDTRGLVWETPVALVYPDGTPGAFDEGSGARIIISNQQCDNSRPDTKTLSTP